MYKLLIVDDETIERESMQYLVPWKSQDITVVGSAWNGVEGCEKIERYTPDIVLTDIKMPVMNGIEMISKMKKKYPNIIFVILSGYGEYEYTKQAMELGVKHYILKPCDEEKIFPVISKVKKEIIENEELLQQKKQYNSSIEKLLPNAKEQFFRNLLKGDNITKREYDFYLNACKCLNKSLRLLGFAIEKESDPLDHFVINNILNEIMGKDKIILHTNIRSKVWFLTPIERREEIETIVLKVKEIYNKYQSKKIDVAISDIGCFNSINDMYEQVKIMLNIGPSILGDELISSDKLKTKDDEIKILIDIKKLKDCRTYEDLYFQIIVNYFKVQHWGYNNDSKNALISAALQRITQEKNIRISNIELENKEFFLDKLVEYLNEQLDIEQKNMPDKMKFILRCIYLNLDNEKLNIQWLADEKVFMNRDYLSRYFKKHVGRNLSSYILYVKMKFAEVILNQDIDVSIIELAKLLGFPEDGQYFSRVFKKYFKLTLTEYKLKFSKE